MFKLLFCSGLLNFLFLLNSAMGLEETQNKKEIDLGVFEKKIYSQHGEDGVIVRLFNYIKPQTKYFVEFGVEDGGECNTRVFLEYFGWKGLMMDGKFSNPSINLHQHFITAENILSLFKQYNIPREFDLLSVDIDGNDWYVWEKILQEYQPLVVVMEYNPNFFPDIDKIITYNSDFYWICPDPISHCVYHGASALALYKLGRKYKYSLVYIEKSATNMFFVRDDILTKLNVVFKNTNNLESLFRFRQYGGTDQDTLDLFEWNNAKELLGENK